MNIKLQLTVILTVIFAFSSFAQKSIELTPYYGYSLNGKIRTYSGDFNVADNPNYGGILSVKVQENMFLELMYNRNDTRFTYSRYGVNPTAIDLAIEYYQIGTLRQFDASDVVKPFGAFTIGATRFNPKDSYDWDGNGTITNLNDAWAFSATLGAGVKLMISDKVGLRLQGRLLLPMRFEGLFIGIGNGGTSGSASFSVPIISGDFTAGLVIRLGE